MERRADRSIGAARPQRMKNLGGGGAGKCENRSYGERRHARLKKTFTRHSLTPLELIGPQPDQPAERAGIDAGWDHAPDMITSHCRPTTHFRCRSNGRQLACRALQSDGG